MLADAANAGQPTLVDVVCQPLHEARAPVSDLSSQRRVRRSAVRITVHPRLIGPRTHGFDVYPRAYPYEWPGPLAKRDCVAWLTTEARPSGTYVVPRQRCWWYFPG